MRPAFTAVHVNRVLQGLQRDGLIERDRRIIRFPKLGAHARRRSTSIRDIFTRASSHA